MRNQLKMTELLDRGNKPMQLATSGLLKQFLQRFLMCRERPTIYKQGVGLQMS